MPYDPTKPTNGEIADADMIREKFDHVNGRIDEANARIDGIPAGPQGEQGPAGADGQQGPPGEVTMAQLGEAIGTTARNPYGTAPFTGTFSDPVTRAEMEAYVAWNEARWQAIVRLPT